MKQKRKSKKGQMEMISLTMLGALVMVGFFMFLIFTSKTSKNDRYTTFKSLTTASNFVASILETNTDCNEQHPTLADLIRNCATTKSIECESGGIKYDPCEFINITLNTILSKTLDGIRVPYYFIIKIGEETIYYRISHCKNPANSQTIPYTLPITLESNYAANLELHICNAYKP